LTVYESDSIQNAVDLAASSTAINIKEGTYNENIEITDQNLTLQSVGDTSSTSIAYEGDGDEGTATVDIDASGVTFDGFTVKRTAGKGRGQDASHAQGVVVRKPGVTVKNSDIRGDLSKAESEIGEGYNRFDGLMVLDNISGDVSGVELKGNTVNGFDAGIMLTNFKNSSDKVKVKLKNNTAFSNRHGFVAKKHDDGAEIKTTESSGNDFTGNEEGSIYLADDGTFQGYDVRPVSEESINFKNITTVQDGDADKTATVNLGGDTKVDASFSSTSSVESLSVVSSDEPTGSADELSEDDTEYVDITADGAGNKEEINLTVNVDASQFDNPQEAELKHYKDGEWTTPNIDSRNISGGTLTLKAAVSGLSPFAVVDGPETTSSSGGGGGGAAISASSNDGGDDDNDGGVAGDQDTDDEGAEDESEDNEPESGRVLGEQDDGSAELTNAQLNKILTLLRQRLVLMLNQLEN